MDVAHHVIIYTVALDEYLSVADDLLDGAVGRLPYILHIHLDLIATAIHLEMWQQGGMQYGVTIEFTDTEKDLLKNIEINCFSINKFAKTHSIDRRDVQKLIAKLVRFGVLDYTFVDRKFKLSL